MYSGRLGIIFYIHLIKVQTDNLEWEKKIIPSIYENIKAKVNQTGNTRKQIGDFIYLMQMGKVLKNLKIRPEYLQKCKVL